MPKGSGDGYSELIDEARSVYEEIENLKMTTRQLDILISDSIFTLSTITKTLFWQKTILSGILNQTQSSIEQVHYEVQSTHKRALKELLKQKLEELKSRTLPGIFMDYKTEVLGFRALKNEMETLSDEIEEISLDIAKEKVQKLVKRMEEVTSEFDHNMKSKTVRVLGGMLATLAILYVGILALFIGMSWQKDLLLYASIFGILFFSVLCVTFVWLQKSGIVWRLKKKEVLQYLLIMIMGILTGIGSMVTSTLEVLVPVAVSFALLLIVYIVLNRRPSSGRVIFKYIFNS